MFTAYEILEAPHTAAYAGEDRGGKEDLNATKNEIYNYILREKWTI